MIRQWHDPYQNRLCSINKVSKNVSFGLSINQDRSYHKTKLTPVYEEFESDTSNYYTEIVFDDEEKIDEELLYLKTEFELFNENCSLQTDNVQKKTKVSQKVKHIPLLNMIR